jgi:hypothetical protein
MIRLEKVLSIPTGCDRSPFWEQRQWKQVDDNARWEVSLMDTLEGAGPDGLTNADRPIVNNDGPGKTADTGLESLSLSSSQAGDAGSIAGLIDPNLPDPLLGAIISSDYLPGLEHALDRLTTSINRVFAESSGRI